MDRLIEPDTFKILVATDIHLGYAEDDQERGDDSFNTFEEILQLADSNEVDFILLGGDLFHHNKPSPLCLYKCMSLLRKYCIGNRPVSVEFLSEPSENFENPNVNYEDPNLNISIPVFSIHGNHDDPSGQSQISTLNLLSANGLVNYVKKSADLKEIEISPILLRKGKSKLAIYGLNYILDDRLSRLFQGYKVKMLRTNEDTDEWFNLLVCHQNRVDRGINKYIQEDALPRFMDLVIWGHEHECRLRPEYNPTQNFYVSQPGSSVATSLCDGEAAKKHVGLLRISSDKKFTMEQLPLKTVRPFIFETIILSECNVPTNDQFVSKNVENYLEERIEFWIEQSRLQLTGHKKQPEMPLIRVRTEYSDESQCFNTIRFGQRFVGRVANSTDIVLMRKEKRPGQRNVVDADRDAMEEILQQENVDLMWETRLNSIIEKYFAEVDNNKKLQVLSVKKMSEASAVFIDKEEKNSIRDTLKFESEKLEKYLCDNKIEVNDIDDALETLRVMRMRNPDEDLQEWRQARANSRNTAAVPPTPTDTTAFVEDSDEDKNEDDDFSGAQRGVRGRGRGRGRGRARGTTSAPRSRGRARGNSSIVPLQESTRNTRNKAAVSMDITTTSNSGRSRVTYDSEDSS